MSCGRKPFRGFQQVPAGRLEVAGDPMAPRRAECAGATKGGLVVGASGRPRTALLTRPGSNRLLLV